MLNNLKNEKPVKIEIETFTSLGGNTLASLIEDLQSFSKTSRKMFYFFLIW